MSSNKKQRKINIRGLKTVIDDEFYRYKMEEVNVIQQKQKTAIDNIEIICKELERDLVHMLKYLKTYFGISIEYKNNVALTSKILDKTDLQNAIYKYIDDFVLCRKCCNPETTLEFKKKSTIMTCKACSFSAVI